MGVKAPSLSSRKGWLKRTISTSLEKEWKVPVAMGEADSYAPLCRMTEGWEEKPLWVDTWKIGCESADKAIIISLLDPGAW